VRFPLKPCSAMVVTPSIPAGECTPVTDTDEITSM
jgi:hypothetical protein